MKRPDPPYLVSLHEWIDGLRAQVAKTAPDLLALFDTYASEAVFGRSYVESDLARFPRGACVLEVGAGPMILSCQLIREGFAVTSLEPTGSGFSHFHRIRELVLEHAAGTGNTPRILNVRVEELREHARYDYAFSINVMEHVDDVTRAIDSVMNSLKTGAIYRFTCPNYLFPYEPHFDIPTFFSKRLTLMLLRPRILGNRSVVDPAATWESLNWIDVLQIRRIAARHPEWTLTLSPSVLASAIERVVADAEFAARRSLALRKALQLLVRARLHRLFQFVPVALQPIIDCSLANGSPLTER